MAAPTYFGSASNPADNGTGQEPVTLAVTPPASMVAGDLVILIGQEQVADNTLITLSQQGGQTWNGPLEVTAANDMGMRLWWAQFNGTWSADPSIAFGASGGNQPTTAFMHVFRPSAAGTWVVDQTMLGGSEASADPVVVSDVTPTKRDNVSLAAIFVTGAPTLAALSGTGWVTTGTNQYRNTSGSDQTALFAHRLQATPAATADASFDLSGSASGISFTMVWYNQITPPTIVLNTADAFDFGSDTTPTLEATATDGNADDVRYQVQISSVDSWESVADSYSESNIDTWGGLFTPNVTASAQSFTGVSGTLDSVTVFLRKSGLPTGNAVAKLYAHSGTFGTSSLPTGEPLATSSVLDVSTLDSVGRAVNFTFTGANRVTLVNGTKYVMSVEYSGGDINNQVQYGTDDIGGPTHPGNASNIVNGTWTAFPSEDRPFYVYVFVSELQLSKISGTDAGFLNTVNPKVVDSYSEVNQSGEKALHSATSVGTAQSFSTVDAVLKIATFYLRKFGSPTGNATVKLYAISGTSGTDAQPTGAALATADVLDVSTLTTSFQLIEFTFPVGQQYSMGAGSYAIAIEYSGGDVNNRLEVGADVTSPTHTGNRADFNGSTWTEQHPGNDLVFYVEADVTDTDPFNSGEKVSYTVQAGDELTGGTWYVRWRALDPNGGNTWSAWATPRTFTITVGQSITIVAGSYALTGNATGLTRQRVIQAAAGSYALTGQATNLAWGRSMALVAGTYSLTGQAATLAWGHKLTAEAGSYSLTGQAAGLVRGRSITLDSGTYALTGNDAATVRGRSITINQGTYALTGNTATLAWGHAVTAISGNYVLTGQAASLAWGRSLSAVAGSYSLTGNAATLTRVVSLTADAGSYSLTGQATTLAHGRSMSAVAGAYALTGQSATLAWGHVIPTVAGAYNLTGNAATLTHTQAATLNADSGSYSLTGNTAGLSVGKAMLATSGAYALTGQDASLLWNHALLTDAGSYALTGNTAALVYGKTITTDAGAYSLTGQAAALIVGRYLTADVGSYSLTGQSTVLAWNHALETVSGTYNLTGQDATLTHATATTLVAESGTYSLTGNVTGLSWNHVLSAQAGSYALTGQTVGLAWQHVLEANSGAYNLTGNDATLTHATASSLVADSGSYAITGNPATLAWNRVLVTVAGSYALTGNTATLSHGYTLSADAGAYNLTGNAATFTQTRVLTANSGSYSLIGQAATLAAGRALLAEAGTYSLTGNAATFTVPNRTLNAVAGSYLITGHTAELAWHLAFPDVTEADPRRYLFIPFEDRFLNVAHEDRFLNVKPDDRTRNV